MVLYEEDDVAGCALKEQFEDMKKMKGTHKNISDKTLLSNNLIK